ncbi:hypothetical protein EVAR_74247_1 [Eumeta japonica]|uniref:Uncharacterized protein n=1 Tax=Eumeta variegata TaxID=151549 RepID=A0A4C1SCP2_EUMVA|nr:hypothetical protein EVAR_74247_1 [Eumeta japonica]
MIASATKAVHGPSTRNRLDSRLKPLDVKIKSLWEDVPSQCAVTKLIELPTEQPNFVRRLSSFLCHFGAIYRRNVTVKPAGTLHCIQRHNRLEIVRDGAI